MLSTRELQILDACANGPELFYFPFAEINYGGQVVSASTQGPGSRRFERFTDEGLWQIKVPREDGASDIVSLMTSEFLKCWRVSDDPLDSHIKTTDPVDHSGIYSKHLEIQEPDEREFAAYAGYACVTWNEHMERFGYGPHEFSTTEEGVKELHLPIYDRYARQLGWE